MDPAEASGAEGSQDFKVGQRVFALGYPGHRDALLVLMMRELRRLLARLLVRPGLVVWHGGWRGKCLLLLLVHPVRVGPGARAGRSVRLRAYLDGILPAAGDDAVMLGGID